MATESRASDQSPDSRVEPWMSGALIDVHPVIAALLYSFQHARADLDAWTKDFSTEDLSRSVLGLAPVCFHIRHIAGSVGRLLTYARGEQLSSAQLSELCGTRQAPE